MMDLRRFSSKLISLSLFCLLCLPLGKPLFPGQDVPLWKIVPQKRVLSNGLSVVYHKDDSSATTVLHIVAKAGKTAQPEEKEGLAYLTTRLLLEIPDARLQQFAYSPAYFESNTL